MGLMDRVRNICLTPRSEWAVIGEEQSTQASLVTGYVIPLAAVGAIAGFIGGSLVGHSIPFVGSYRVPIMTGIALALFTLGMAVVGVFMLSLVINALAPTFGGTKSPAQAFKVAVYSSTPAWIAGVLQIVPALGILALFGGLYALYVLYLGLPRLMKAPDDKAIAYTVTVVICAIVLFAVIGVAQGVMVGAGFMGARVASGAASPDVQFDPNSPAGKLQELGAKMEESGRQMEAARKAGDQQGQAAAAMGGLATLFGGGKHFEPIGVAQLQAFVPVTFAGLPRTSNSAEKVGVAGLMVSKAEAVYGGGPKRVTLELSDTGGAGGLMGLASWTGVQSEKEDDDSSERTHKIDGRLVHEKRSKRGGDNEFAVVIGDRFILNARGEGVDLDSLKAAVSSIDLGKLESLKDVNGQQ